jgi:uncharacterized protein (DUF983 family)
VKVTLKIDKCYNCGESYEVDWTPDSPAQQSINCPNCSFPLGSVWLNVVWAKEENRPFDQIISEELGS